MARQLPSNKARPNSRQLRDVLEEKGFDPVQELVTLANNDDTTNRLKFEISRTFMEYLYSKKKAIAVENDHASPIQFNMDFGNKDK